MSADVRIETYLRQRAATLDVPHVEVEALAARARRRRRRQSAVRGGLGLVVMMAVAIASIGAVGRSDPDSTAGVGVGAAVGESAYEWSLVDVSSGLGWSSPPVSVDGALYSLSTAPPSASTGDEPAPDRLYRSEDGVEWADVALPDGMSATGLAAQGDSLYAVGTGAAGGAVTLATSGGDGWSTSSLPVDLAALEEGFPGRLWIDDVQVVVDGGTTIVAVSVVGDVRASEVIDGAVDDDWAVRGEGLLDLEASAAASCDEPEPAAEPSAPPPTDATEATCEGEVVRPWAELGVSQDAGLMAVEGRTLVYRSVGGGEPTLVEAPIGALAPDGASLVVTDSGFALARVRQPDPSLLPELVVWWSADGASWNATTVSDAELGFAFGVLDGRAMYVAGEPADEEPFGTSIVAHVLEADGTVSSIDVRDMFGLGRDSAVDVAAVGPGGVAIVAVASGGHQPLVLHSADGRTWSSVEVPGPDDGDTQDVGAVVVTPDAIKVRLDERPSTGSPSEPPPPVEQRLFVGTPAD